MNKPRTVPSYNQRIPHMSKRVSSGLQAGWLSSFLLATFFLPPSLCASELGDRARELAHKIAAASGPGAFALEISNRSTLGEKSVREVSGALETELDVEGVHIVKAERAMGTVRVVLSESVRDYVWTAETVIGSDEAKVALVSLSRPATGTAFAPALPVVLKATRMFAQEQPILDVALVDVAGGYRPIVLGDGVISVYSRQGLNIDAKWELEVSLPISHSRAFPRDLRGRLLLRRDHLFDVYLPGVFCRSSSVASLTIACNDTDDPWPLTSYDDSVRGFFAASRNFFTGALSPGIGKISNVPSFYSAAEFPRADYKLWALAAIDGSLHLVDGMTDLKVRGAKSKWGSDLAAVHSGCGSGTQLLVSEAETPERDALRAFEIPDRDPVPVSSALDVEGQIVALWPETNGSGVTAVVRKKDSGWYEAYRISISCGN